MSSKTKIMVVKMREIIYTAIFLALIVLLVVLLVMMFSSRSEEEIVSQFQNGTQTDASGSGTSQTDAPQTDSSQTGTSQTDTTQAGTSQTDTSGRDRSLSGTASSSSAQYIAGVYTTPVTLGDSAVDVEVVVDENRINSIRLVNLSESITAMYPLVSPSLDEIAAQICETQSLENITCPEDNKYTSQLLLNAVAQALQNARRPAQTSGDA